MNNTGTTFSLNGNQFKVKDSQLIYSLLGHEKKPSDAELEKTGRSESCKEATEYVAPFFKGTKVINLYELLSIMNEIGISVDPQYFPTPKLLNNIFVNKLFVKKIAQAIIYNGISIFEIGDMLRQVVVKSNKVFESIHCKSLQISLDGNGVGNFFNILDNKKKEMLKTKMVLGKYLSFGDPEEEKIEKAEMDAHLKLIGREAEPETIVPEILSDPIDTSEKYTPKVAMRVNELKPYLDIRSFEVKCKDMDKRTNLFDRIKNYLDSTPKAKQFIKDDKIKLQTVDEHGYILKMKEKDTYFRMYNDPSKKPKMFTSYKELANEFK